MEQKEKMTAADVKSTTSRDTAFEVGSYWVIESSLAWLRGEIVEVLPNEIVVKPFRFEQNCSIKYHNGLSEPFLKEMVIGRSQIVHAKQWSPA